MYDERFAPTHGTWRPVVREVADKFLTCGVVDHGFARIRCDTCPHEYLLAFSCKGRYFRPSCHAKRLALWEHWLDATLLAPVPHRQVVLTIPKRRRAYCLDRRRLLGDIARVAAHTFRAAVRALTGERDLAVGIVAGLQTHGSRANWHPHLHWRPLAPTEARRRWAELLRQSFEGRPAGVPAMRWGHADPRVHHAGDRRRSDPYAPPHAHGRGPTPRRA